MNFLQHTLAWTRGEILEAALIGLGGFLAMAAGFAFWKLGTTPAAKAMLMPLLILGALLVATGVGSHINNRKRLVTFERAYAEDAAAFVRAEKERVEGFQWMYTMVLVIAPVCFALATAFFWWSKNPHLRAAGIALVLLGLSGLVIDTFSKERADTYYEHILRALP